MAKFTDLPSLGQSLAGTEIAALVANVSSTLTTVQLPLSTIKTFVLNGTATTATNVAGGGANQILYQSSANTTAFVPAPTTTGNALVWNGSSLSWGWPVFGTSLTGLLKGNGSSVSAAISGTDYAPGTSALATGIVKSTTTTGALTIAAGSDINSTFGSQTQNYVYAAPGSGGNGNATFRALVAADIPSLTSAQLATIVSDETGTGVAVFGTSPAITTSITTASTTFSLINATATTVNFAGGATTALNIGASGAPITGFSATATTSSTAASLGYMGTPINTQASTYTLVIGDAGKTIYAGGNLTIPANGGVAFPIGTIINIIASAGITVAITTDTLQWGGQASSTTGTRTIAQYGMASLVKVAATTWYISGAGVT